MLAVVKTHHIKFTVEGSIPVKLRKFLKSEYGNKVQFVDDEQLVDVAKTDWYQSMNDQDHPGKVLRVYRDNADLTQQKMADILGVSKARVSDFENGHRNMSKEIIKKVAKYFKVPVERLL